MSLTLLPGPKPQRIFDAAKAVIVEAGVSTAKHRQAINSAVLDDAVPTRPRSRCWWPRSAEVRRLVLETALVPTREHCLESGQPPCDWDDSEDRGPVVL